jgi:ketosteroid isomerase-like protein
MPHDLIETFYRAFAALDAEAMAACYHDEVTFEDPAFGQLQGEQADRKSTRLTPVT